MHQCFKCKQGIGTVASRDGPEKVYCPVCFLAYCAGAVRENAFQRCFVPSDTPLAVATSGGPNSMLLLRELGQLRYKARDHLRRQQLVQQRCASAQGKRRDGAPVSPSSTSSASSVSNLILLPFHLCEDDLVLPPPPPLPPRPSSSPSPSSLRESSGRPEVIEKVRSAMEEQFEMLRKCVLQQPPQWVYHDDAPSRRKSAKKQQNNTTAAVGMDVARAGGAHVDTPESAYSGGGSGESAATTACLFSEAEMRLFYYSDFLSGAYLSEVRHALHASRLSLSDREALYARVRQQTLCRAAQRLCMEYRQRAAAAAAIGETTGEEVTRRGDEVHCFGQRERLDEHSPLRGTSWETRSHLLLGSNAARCAIAALEALVTGASGEGVVHGAGFRGFTHEVVCLRPLRTILPKETVLYTRLCGILSSYTPALRTSTATRSIHRTLEQFVLTMMASYRTMIFNVLNMVQRLEVHPASMQEFVRATCKFPASQAHEKHGGSAAAAAAAAGRSQLGAKTSTKALPSRTAQQNRDDLRLAAPLHVHRDLHGVTSKEAGITSTIAICCVCGCPASIAAGHCGRQGNTAVRQLELFAVSATGAAVPRKSSATSTTLAGASSSETSAVMGSCFICYACQGLAKTWPPSVFGRDRTTEKEELGSGNRRSAGGVASFYDATASTSTVLQLCALFH
ncbi:hypothetical protein CUR178_07787 [Leishmania enriettii]|uniref:Cytoplasmic tRNA 2-thiolation protein 2 n=1 Tax=Leishmania enriettii TaxID=5663 RepID=A0A836GY66_LEIEN|nr:hypothetical protein CUR178_07787 [Leishmania enriettii]